MLCDSAFLKRTRAGLCSSEARAALTHARLDELGVAYTTTRHAAAVKLEDLMAALSGLPGTPCKNLFIKAKKEKAPGDSRMWLVVAAHDTKVDLVALATKLGYGKIVLRFGGERAARAGCTVRRRASADAAPPLRAQTRRRCSRTSASCRATCRRSASSTTRLCRCVRSSSPGQRGEQGAGATPGASTQSLIAPPLASTLPGQRSARRAHPQARGRPALLSPADQRGQHRCARGGRVWGQCRR